MRTRWLVAASAILIAACSEPSQSPTSPGNEPSFNLGRGEGGPQPHLFFARGLGRPKKGSPDMTWHNGGILASSFVQNIFWGASWGNSGFVGDKISGLDGFASGINGSNYGATCDEYTGSNGQVTDVISHGSDLIDLSTASGGGSASAILAEVCKEIPNPVANGLYNVYVDLKRGQAQYCAWHSYGSCGSTPVQFAFYWNLDGDSGCDPQDTQTGHSQGLAALANVTAHELSETRTDPRGTGWYDGSGAENGDKCAWTFNVPYVTFSDGNIWKVQGEWSNAAYNGGTGYPNLSGQPGCLDGH